MHQNVCERKLESFQKFFNCKIIATRILEFQLKILNAENCPESPCSKFSQWSFYELRENCTFK